MVSTYVGKLNLGNPDHLPYADNEIIVMIFPNGFDWESKIPLQKPVVIYHQWSKGGDGQAKATSSALAKVVGWSYDESGIPNFRVRTDDEQYYYQVRVVGDEVLKADMYQVSVVPSTSPLTTIEFKREWASLKSGVEEST